MTSREIYVKCVKCKAEVEFIESSIKVIEIKPQNFLTMIGECPKCDHISHLTFLLSESKKGKTLKSRRKCDFEKELNI